MVLKGQTQVKDFGSWGCLYGCGLYRTVDEDRLSTAQYLSQPYQTYGPEVVIVVALLVERPLKNLC